VLRRLEKFPRHVRGAERTLTVRIQAYQMTALVARQPVGIGVNSGTGHVSPTFA
jgi:hypothetical protein